jgi:Ca2+-binding EF-hand superfamily protein
MQRCYSLLFADLLLTFIFVSLCSSVLLLQDNDGSLDKMEFKAALSAMSVPVKDDAALDALLLKVTGGPATVSLEAWIAYLTELNTDRDTPEQIIEAFKTLADDRATISPDNLRVPPLTAEDIEFLQTQMPAGEGGLDYTAFVNSSFVAKH